MEPVQLDGIGQRNQINSRSSRLHCKRGSELFRAAELVLVLRLVDF